MVRQQEEAEREASAQNRRQRSALIPVEAPPPNLRVAASAADGARPYEPAVEPGLPPSPQPGAVMDVLGLWRFAAWGLAGAILGAAPGMLAASFLKLTAEQARIALLAPAALLGALGAFVPAFRR